MFQTIRRRGRHRDERGAALVEFALLLPLLMCLILGMVTGGMAWNRKISMTNAVREGSRFGATLTPATMTAAGWNAAADKIRARVVEIATDDLQPADICVQYVHIAVGPSPSVQGQALTPACAVPGASPNPLTSAAVGDCVVSVWAQTPSTGPGAVKLQAFFFTRDVALKARAVARYERTPC